MGENKEPFKKLELLGTGGFAQTWLALVLDPYLIEEWGVKEVAIKIPLDKQKERILKKEVELTGGLRLQITEEESRNIVDYLGFEIFDGKLVMVMKYVKEGSLRTMMGRIGHWKRIDLNKTISIAKGVLKGLSAIHSKRIVHRDIKPENILMDEDVPKIADFGIGKMLRTNDLASTTTGTLYYMSPEILDEESSFNTDIWSFGVTIYEMICGQFPFGIKEDMPPGKIIDLIRNIHTDLNFPTEVFIDRNLLSIIARSLKKNPKERYQTANEILKDFRKYFKDEDDEYIEKCAIEMQELLKIGEFKKAERKLKDLINKYPKNPRSYLCLGEYYNRCQRYKEAIQVFKKGVQISPDHALLYRDMALSLFQQGSKGEAIEALKKSIGLGLESVVEKHAASLLKLWESK